MLSDISGYLQKSHQSEVDYHKIKIKELSKLEASLNNKINKLLDIYLEGTITEEIYNFKNKTLKTQIIKAKTERQTHENADNDFKTTIVTAFELANKSSELFESSKISEKRELIKFVFSNLTLNGKKLEYTLHKPFDMMVNLSSCSNLAPGEGLEPPT